MEVSFRQLTANFPPLLKVWGGQMLEISSSNSELHFHAFSSVQIPFWDNPQCDFVGVLLGIISQWSLTSSDFQPGLPAWSSPSFSPTQHEAAMYPVKSPPLWRATPLLPFPFKAEWRGRRALPEPALPGHSCPCSPGSEPHCPFPVSIVLCPVPASQPDPAQARLTRHCSWKSSPSQAPFPGWDGSLSVETHYTVSILITSLVTLSYNYIYLFLLHQTEFLENSNAEWHACLFRG